MIEGIVKAECLSKEACTILASNARLQGDPCEGTAKYLAVTYLCQPP